MDDVKQQRPDRELDHYTDPDEVLDRFTRLYLTVIECLDQQTTEPICLYSEVIARDRLSAGLDIGEVQDAFNLFEEAVARAVLPQLPDEGKTEADLLITTILGAGKDVLARAWISLLAPADRGREEATLVSIIVDSVIVLHSEVPREALEGFAEEALAKTRDAHVQGHRLPLAQHDVRDKAVEWKRQHQAAETR